MGYIASFMLYHILYMLLHLHILGYIDFNFFIHLVGNGRLLPEYCAEIHFTKLSTGHICADRAYMYIKRVLFLVGAGCS